MVWTRLYFDLLVHHPLYVALQSIQQAEQKMDFSSCMADCWEASDCGQQDCVCNAILQQQMYVLDLDMYKVTDQCHFLAWLLTQQQCSNHARRPGLHAVA